MTNRKHRAEVIEVYPNEGKAAIRFKWRGRDRIECVKLYNGPDCFELTLGMKGWAIYTMTANTGLWGFTPYPKQPKYPSEPVIEPLKDITGCDV